MADLFAQALAYVAALGAAGYAAIVFLYALSCVACMPVSALTFGAGAVFGLRLGFGLVWAGAMIGACASFLIARHWLRGWVEKRLARHPVFAVIDAAISAQGWRVVFLTRLTPLFPCAFLNYAYGVTRVKFGEYALASCVAMTPGIFLFVYLGAVTGAVVKNGTSGRVRAPAEWMFFGVGVLASAAVVRIIGRAASQALSTHVKSQPSKV